MFLLYKMENIGKMEVLYMIGLWEYLLNKVPMNTGWKKHEFREHT